MKKLCLAIIVYALLTYLNSENTADKIGRSAERMARKAEIVAEKAEEVAREIEIQVSAEEIQQKPENTRMETPFMGVYFEDLTFEGARKRNYKYMYGVLISRVTSGTPAKLYRLIDGDILMEIGENKIYGSDHATRVISSYYVGDKVNLKIFRDGEVKIVEFVFGSRFKKSEKTEFSAENRKKESTV